MRDPNVIPLYDEVSDKAYTLPKWAAAAIAGKQFKRKPRVAWKFPDASYCTSNP